MEILMRGLNFREKQKKSPKQMNNILRKLSATKLNGGEKFINECMPKDIDTCCHLIHTFSPLANEKLKDSIHQILTCKTPASAKKKMLSAHHTHGAGFMDFLKKGASTMGSLVKNFGSNAVKTTGSFFNKAVPLAQKGFAMAKPFIRDYAPSAVAFGVSHIPVVGPTIAPIVKKAAEWGLNKLIPKPP